MEAEKLYARAFDPRGCKLARTFSFSNTLFGFEAFNAWVHDVCEKKEKIKAVVGLEPTGHCWFDFGSFLEECDMTIAMVNPYHVKQTMELMTTALPRMTGRIQKQLRSLSLKGDSFFHIFPMEYMQNYGLLWMWGERDRQSKRGRSLLRGLLSKAVIPLVE